MLRGRRYSPRTCATSPIDEQPSRSYEPPIAGSNRSRQSRRRFGTWPPWWPRARSRARCSTPSANRQGCCLEPPASTWPTSRRMPTASRWQGGACTMHTYPRAPGCRLMVKPSTIVRRTRRPARIETYEGVGGELAARLRSLGIRCDVGAPVFVDGGGLGRVDGRVRRLSAVPRRRRSTLGRCHQPDRNSDLQRGEPERPRELTDAHRHRGGPDPAQNRAQSPRRNAAAPRLTRARTTRRAKLGAARAP